MKRRLLLGAGSSLLAGAGLLRAQTAYPNKAIRYIVPVAAGGGSDMVGRTVTERWGKQLNQTFVVDNQAGGGGVIACQLTAKAPPDGYTLLQGYVATHGTSPATRKLPYDPIKDFTPIGMIGGTPNVLVVNSSLPVNTLKEFADYLRKNPGRLSYGSGGVGTLQHVWGAVLLSSLGVEALHVPFKGAAPAHQEMMGGRLDVMFDNMSASKQYVQAGKLKGLVVSSATRSPHLAQVPTVNETGLTRFEGESWFGIFAPTGTPPAVVAKLREAMAQINREPEFIARVERDGGRLLNIPPAQQQAFLQDEIERWVGSVQTYNVTAD